MTMLFSLLSIMSVVQGCDSVMSVLSKKDHESCEVGSKKSMVDELEEISKCVAAEYRRNLSEERLEHAAALRGALEVNRELQTCSPLCSMCSGVSSYWFCANWCRGCYRRELATADKTATTTILTKYVSPDAFKWSDYGMKLVDNEKCVAMAAGGDEAMMKCLQGSKTAIDAAC
ncbi:hypothetical protein ACA910_008835 [Epithemia clementina (nom. ined.)]